jgi:hypothetical protein
MNWVIKDGLGQAGGIAFAAWLGRRKGMDGDPKKWRSVSALAMDAATLLEILSPLVPGHFLAVASVANVGKNIACVRFCALLLRWLRLRRRLLLRVLLLLLLLWVVPTGGTVCRSGL